jgi:hypothetical protein
MNDQPENAEKNIIIDEDWKTRVQTEKEEAAASKATAEKQASLDGQSTEPGAEDQEQIPLPPPTLSALVSSLAMQAMVAMGLVSSPDEEEKPMVYLDHAKHYIDTIGMLEEKTAGNRTPEETTLFGNVLHELRMSYVAVQNQGGLATP